MSSGGLWKKEGLSHGVENSPLAIRVIADSLSYLHRVKKLTMWKETTFFPFTTMRFLIAF